MVSQPGSPLSSPTKNKKQKVSGTLIQGWPANLSLLIFSLATSLARAGTVRSLWTSIICSHALTLDRVPQGPSPNPRYPRVSANPRSCPSPNAKGRQPLLGHALLLLAPRQLPLPVFLEMGGRMAQAAPWKKRGSRLAFRAHHDRLRGGLRQTILSVSAFVVLLLFGWVLICGGFRCRR